jgi:hypothetical protein
MTGNGLCWNLGGSARPPWFAGSYEYELLNMNYASLDPQIQDWVQRHALKLFTPQGEHEIRTVYVSGISGECFQIWIDPPENGQTYVYAGCVEGRREDDAYETWRIPVAGLRTALGSAFKPLQTGWHLQSASFLQKLQTKKLLQGRSQGLVFDAFP